MYTVYNNVSKYEIISQFHDISQLSFFKNGTRVSVRNDLNAVIFLNTYIYAVYSNTSKYKIITIL